jgi:hypothetical protein
VPRGEHETQRRGRQMQQAGQQGMYLRRSDGMVVVEDKDELLVKRRQRLMKHVDDDIEWRKCVRRQQILQRVAAKIGQACAHRRQDVGQKVMEIGRRGVERHPDGRQAAGFQPIGDEGGLAVASRGDNQRQAGAIFQQLEQSRGA